mmetsp:Transcript_28022/g.69319  ORF Transcript_28022/g.69319 Transcript_28022/m.69319 type:complete len:272 (+) Transcript_28022:246-1061(+)
MCVSPVLIFSRSSSSAPLRRGSLARRAPHPRASLASAARSSSFSSSGCCRYTRRCCGLYPFHVRMSARLAFRAATRAGRLGRWMVGGALLCSPSTFSKTDSHRGQVGMRRSDPWLLAERKEPAELTDSKLSKLPRSFIDPASTLECRDCRIDSACIISALATSIASIHSDSDLCDPIAWGTSAPGPLAPLSSSPSSRSLTSRRKVLNPETLAVRCRSMLFRAGNPSRPASSSADRLVLDERDRPRAPSILCTRFCASQSLCACLSSGPSSR